MKPKILVVLANLGGPSSLGGVRSFLFNLFYDKAILRVPNPVRFFLAAFISLGRLRKAKEIYSLLGGKSPILENTLKQAGALKKSLEKDFDVWVVPVMRYSRPRAKDALEVLRAFNPDWVVFLPLYPHFSTTTTQSSIKEWERVAPQWRSKTLIQDSYFDDPYFVGAHQMLIEPFLRGVAKGDAVRVLFSAHGLPQKVVDDGDPYQQQIESSVSSIMEKFKETDYAVCYQSRVGPLKWIGPSLEEELKRAAEECVGVVVVPISFVSDHSETLVELDIEYTEKAREWGVPFYKRVPALGCNTLFIKCLENNVRHLLRKT